MLDEKLLLLLRSLTPAGLAAGVSFRALLGTAVHFAGGQPRPGLAQKNHLWQIKSALIPNPLRWKRV